MKLSNVKCKHAVRVFAVIAALNACGAVHVACFYSSAQPFVPAAAHQLRCCNQFVRPDVVWTCVLINALVGGNNLTVIMSLKRSSERGVISGTSAIQTLTNTTTSAFIRHEIINVTVATVQLRK